MSTRVITVRASDDFAAAAAEAAEALSAGHLVGFATETVYGLGALATNREAMRRLRAIKSRPDGPFSVHLATPSDVKKYVAEISPRARWLMRRAWPGPATLLLATGGKLADEKLHARKGLFEELTVDGTIGLRCPDEPITQQMLAMVDGPVVAPSANLAGAASPKDAADVLHNLGGKIDLLVDSGPAKYGKDSSIVRIDGNDWTCLREGVYDERMLEQMMRRKIAFVCTGNTCRSPIAAGLAKKLLAERFGCKPGKLRSIGVEVVSAGLFAADGGHASPEAVQAAKLLKGVDISRHKSKKLTPELIKTCDMIFCMTSFHLEQVRRLAGATAATKNIYLLDSQREVPDPIGGGLEIYQETAGHIDRAIQQCMTEGIL
jgi:protein-tyrosine phosphatase